jgi:hypothetical protein
MKRIAGVRRSRSKMSTMQDFYPNDRMAYPLYEAVNNGGTIAAMSAVIL